MMLNRIASAALLFTCAATSQAAFAQAVPDITDAINQGSRVEDARRAQQDTAIGPQINEDAEIDGEAGIYVLTVNDIFYVAGGIGGGWSENPLRTVDDEGSSGFGNAVITAGMQTKLAEQFDFGVSVTASGVEFIEDFAPSSRTINSSINVGMPIGGTPIYVGASVYGGRSFDGDFESGTWFYGANAQVSAGIPIGPNTLARATITSGRSESDITENNAWNATASVELTQIITPEVSLGAQARVTRTWFDDFFEDVTFVPRKDWQYGGNVNAVYTPTPWLSAQVSAGYEQRDSGFFLSNYNGFEATFSLTARKRF